MTDNPAFGNNVCDLCGQRHPHGFDCVAAEKREHEEMMESLNSISVPRTPLAAEQTTGGKILSADELASIRQGANVAFRSRDESHVINSLDDYVQQLLKHITALEQAAWANRVSYQNMVARAEAAEKGAAETQAKALEEAWRMIMLDLIEAVTREVNDPAKGGSGYLLARLSEARRFFAGSDT
jgi:hypothetical protein